MAYTQLGPGTNISGTPSATGSATPAGALVVVFAAVRSTTATVSSITDTGGNTWTPLASSAIAGGGASVQIFGWTCPDADPLTSVSVTFDESVASNCSAFVFPTGATVSPVDDLEVVAQTAATPYPACQVTPTEAESAVIGVVALQVTSRVLSQTVDAYTEGTTASANQLLTRYAVDEGAGTSATGPSWSTISGGSPVPAALMTLAVKMGDDAPDPLTINAGADQSIYIGNTATLTATVGGGSGGSTGSWSQVSGPAATIGAPTSLSTTVTPTGGAGAYQFRRTQTEGVEVVTDDVLVTVSAAPAFVTIASVNDSTGWTATGGTVSAVLSDTSDTTFVISADSPTGQSLDVTFGAIDVEAGLVLRLRAEHDDASSGSVTAYLYDDDTLLSTSAPTSFSGTVADINIAFPAVDIVGVTMPAAFRVVTEWTATATA